VNQSPDSRVIIPNAKRIEKSREAHGHVRVDGYAWLRAVDDPDVRSYLAAERTFYESSTDHLRPLVGSLTNEMAARVPETDSSVSYKLIRFSYYNRTPAGSDYEQLWRGVDLREAGEGGPGSGDTLLLDPAELKGDSAYAW
jgi:protease II